MPARRRKVTITLSGDILDALEAAASLRDYQPADVVRDLVTGGLTSMVETDPTLRAEIAEHRKWHAVHDSAVEAAHAADQAVAGRRQAFRLIRGTG